MPTHQECAKPALKDIQRARQVFEANEPRDLFYRVANELVELVIKRSTLLSLAEALAVLLQTWNSSYFRFHGKFDAVLFEELERMLTKHESTLLALRKRSIESLTSTDEQVIAPLFEDFERLLGPVGAAKGLHLLAPYFFPLWDREIAKAYCLPFKERGANAPRYIVFMGITQTQCRTLEEQGGVGRNPLKALDEYNYCKFSRHWM